ncbi:uncharacterized protein METZ01_LOCUS423320 [marine metagenome]|uniref:Uncharacterized protein n=1 Tax=marine metagenome TaxID=408172 RepID=A0A382XH29_9ZZZZ
MKKKLIFMKIKRELAKVKKKLILY